MTCPNKKCGDMTYLPPNPCPWCGYVKRQLTDEQKAQLSERLKKARAIKGGKNNAA